MNTAAPHILINQHSGKVDWYTPPDVLAAARAVMGGIDFDPASSPAANELVQARVFGTAPRLQQVGVHVRDGLPLMRAESAGALSPDCPDWHGRIWLNPPYEKPQEPCDLAHCTRKGCRRRRFHRTDYSPGTGDWVNRLVAEYRRGHVAEAIALFYASLDADWCKPLLDFPIFFPEKRINFWEMNREGHLVEGRSGATKGAMIVYVGPWLKNFARVFTREIGGHVVVPYAGLEY